MSRKEYTIITGARQSGKTSLLMALFNELETTEKTATYISLEDREILTAINEHPENIFAYSPRPGKTALEQGSPEEIIYLFIDEIQYADQPSNFIKYLYDKYRENLKLVATGSNAFYIDSKFRDSLAGRKRIFELHTLDFEEMLNFRRQYKLIEELELIRSQEDYISSRHRELIAWFNEYLIFGGYPEVVLEQDQQEKINLLRDIRDSFLERDIDESGVSNPDKFYRLLQLIAGQTGNLVNRNELALTIEADNKTVGKYLYVLQKCFHIDLIKPFFTNLRKELTKMPKIYFNDSGLRNIALNRFYKFENREDRGKLLENYVFSRLRDLYNADSIRFWRTTDQKEIDFVITTTFDKGKAYEVKMNCQGVKPVAFKKFLEQYSGYSLDIISYNIHQNCKWVLKL
ncbi:MAG: ATP-binding protein [Bacteroidales bacterium]|nr:ATP-binding protein [Bacteroidota bacterium]MBL6949164.1 ATP-binding protein [Bacteroidales bacterium]